MASFLQHIQFQAKAQPKSPAIITVRGVITYEELVGRCHAAIQYLAENGVEAGQTLAVNLFEPISHCCAVIGAMSLGVATISVAGANKLRLPKNLTIDAIISNQEIEKDEGVRLMQVPRTWLNDQQVEEGTLPVLAPRSDRIVRIVGTSGTTGEQKAVPFTEDQLIQRAWGQVVGLRPQLGATKCMGMMGLSSGGGFTNMMLVLMTGGTMMFIPGVAQLARVSALYQIDRIMASTAQLIAMLRYEEQQAADFSGIKSMVVGGSHIPRAVARRARAICKNIICLYGSTEVGVVATAPTQITTQHQSAVGYVVPGVDLEIVDENDNVLGVGREGVIRVKVPDAPNRYLNDEEATKSVFRDGWFYPGDIGSLSRDGLLFVSGRVSERINVGGVKVAPTVIEEVIATRPEVSDVAAFEHVNADGIGEIAVAIVPHKTVERSNFNRAEIRKYFQKQLAEKTPRRWMFVNEIPRNEQGKIDRAQLMKIAQTKFAKVPAN